MSGPDGRPTASLDAAGEGALRIGRYELFDRIASGGMATVYFGRIVGDAGFRRTVALKRLHPHLAAERSFVDMLRDEARLASRIRHPNVVPVLDVVDEGGELLLVLELVVGLSLAEVMRSLRERARPVPLPVAAAILRGALAGLGAAHSATDEHGAPLGLVHRDVSAQNVLVGVDGVVRLVDFGIAKARGRLHTTDDGRLKGNFAYMAPEQAKRRPVTPRTDLFAVGVVAWELLTGRRLHDGDDAAVVLTSVLYEDPPAVSALRDVDAAVDAIVKRALCKDPEGRFESAAAMSEAIGAALPTAPPEAVAAFLRAELGAELTALEQRVERLEKAAPVASPVGVATDGQERAVRAPARPASAPPGTRVTAALSVPPPLLVQSAERAPHRSRLVAGGVVLAAALVAAYFGARRAPVDGGAVAAAGATVDATPPVVASSAPTATAAPTVASTTAGQPDAGASAATSGGPPVPSAATSARRGRTAPTASQRPAPQPGLEGIPRERE